MSAPSAHALLNRLLARGKLRQLQVLLQLAELGSVQRTAPVVGMTQSGVSQTLASLEALLDIPLFIRHARGVLPTPACLELLPTVRQLMLGVAQGAESLAAAQLHEGRDLPVHHDFRAVIAQVLRATQGSTAAQLERLFPGYAWDARLDGLMHRA